MSTLSPLLQCWSSPGRCYRALLARRNVTGPIVFAAAGYVLGNADWGPLPVDIDASSVHVIAEVTLALLLFADAARVNVGKLRADTTLPVRLLGIGFPLSVVLGAVLAGLLFDLPWGLALFLGASLAPTDAALSLQVINDERIPMRLRRALNVESGLNDGIATPIVTFSIAVAASQLGHVNESVSFAEATALRELAVGVGIGILLGGLGAVALNRAARLGWMGRGGRLLASLALGNERAHRDAGHRWQRVHRRVRGRRHVRSGRRPPGARRRTDQRVPRARRRAPRASSCGSSSAQR